MTMKAFIIHFKTEVLRNEFSARGEFWKFLPIPMLGFGPV